MFEENPTARSDLRPGTLYAVAGPSNGVFFGQVCADQSFAFFREHGAGISAFSPNDATLVMSRFAVNVPSVGRALRKGAWKKIGKAALPPELFVENTYVQWPVGTLDVHVWRGASITMNTLISDPAIQDFEVMAVWDAEVLVPLRLLVDFSPEEAARISPKAWSVGGPVWRDRRVREEYARRFPGGSHDLPKDWVPTEREA